jgi:hypothetical protein
MHVSIPIPLIFNRIRHGTHQLYGGFRPLSQTLCSLDVHLCFVDMLIEFFNNLDTITLL